MIRKKWKIRKQKCLHCGKYGVKNFGNEKFLHKKCKKDREYINHRLYVKRKKLKEKKIIDEYLDKINICLIRKIRNCNSCNEKFNSDGFHNQICEKCNVIAENEPELVRIYKYPEI